VTSGSGGDGIVPRVFTDRDADARIGDVPHQRFLAGAKVLVLIEDVLDRQHPLVVRVGPIAVGNITA
jgi:hypothetical protein